MGGPRVLPSRPPEERGKNDEILFSGAKIFLGARNSTDITHYTSGLPHAKMSEIHRAASAMSRVEVFTRETVIPPPEVTPVRK